MEDVLPIVESNVNDKQKKEVNVSPIKEDASTPVKPIVVKAPTITAKPYINNGYLYSIIPPINWVASTTIDSGEVVVRGITTFHDKSDLKEIPDTEISIISTPKDLVQKMFSDNSGMVFTDEDIVNSLLEDEKTTNNEWVLDSLTKINFNNTIAYEIKSHYLAKADSRPVILLEYFISDDKIYHLITVYSYTDVWHKYKKVVTDSLATFKIIK